MAPVAGKPPFAGQTAYYAGSAAGPEEEPAAAEDGSDEELAE